MCRFYFEKSNLGQKNIDHGLILAFEDIAGIVNTSAILECLDGLFYLASDTHKKIYQERALEAVKFVKNKLYLKGQRTFLDGYDYKNHKAVDSYNYELQEENHLPLKSPLTQFPLDLRLYCIFDFLFF